MTLMKITAPGRDINQLQPQQIAVTGTADGAGSTGVPVLFQRGEAFTQDTHVHAWALATGCEVVEVAGMPASYEQEQADLSAEVAAKNAARVGAPLRDVHQRVIDGVQWTNPRGDWYIPELAVAW